MLKKLRAKAYRNLDEPVAPDEKNYAHRQGILSIEVPSVIIAADEEVIYDYVVQVLHAVKNSGLLKISLTPNTQGRLRGVKLKHTEVKAGISGFLARVEVTQTFQNPYTEKIEAVYVFPLPQNAAVDDMLMKIGERTIRGLIKKREEAREIYEKAKQRSQVASLLEQERPNIFTQSVANIMPG